jgi:hypothetical protein
VIASVALLSLVQRCAVMEKLAAQREGRPCSRRLAQGSPGAPAGECRAVASRGADKTEEQQQAAPSDHQNTDDGFDNRHRALLWPSSQRLLFSRTQLER